ncbi:MAG: sigma-54-dependent transcriptional regulator, partial [Deferrisomatales bacterium]
MPNHTVLIVDDEYLIRWSLSENLKQDGVRCVTAESGEEALEAFRSESPDLVLLDIKLPGMDGIQVLERIKEIDRDVPVIMVTATSHVDTAVKAMKLGAYDYVSKPFDLTEVRTKVRHAVENTRLRREVEYLRTCQAEGRGFDRIIGNGPRMKEVIAVARKVAQSSSTTALLQGESGTGKDLLAQAIHFESARRSRPFMPINCTALPEELLESELMGHERGAFTDAKKTKKGLFELADGGTLFLDEIGDMKPGLQAKILRFLEERTFKRVGGKDDIEVDVRIVAATNKDLEQAIADRTFREDLYYRLSVVPITLPPLRERRDDIVPLGRHFLEGFNRDFKVSFTGLTPEAEALMVSYDWPGNIRELRNVIERAVILSVGDEI